MHLHEHAGITAQAAFLNVCALIFLLSFFTTPNCILLVNTSQIQKLAAPLELSAAPKGSAAPWLRTTGLEIQNIYCIFDYEGQNP